MNHIEIKRLPDVIWDANMAFRKTNRPHDILVAEDDQDMRRLVTEVLTRSGYNVDAAQDGAVAWEILQLKSHHLLITDFDMPKMSGIELIRKARAARMALPVIMVSGTMPENEIKQNSSLRISATLFKPFGVDDLLKTVRHVLDAAVSVSVLEV
jgi:two-component system chemotaxis response regulator CheY